MQQTIMIIMALGAVLGGVDKLMGCRFGLGQRFDEGFQLLGPIALSMAGILCLEPLLSGLLSVTAAPLLRACGLDASILAGLLAIDMGGFPMAQALASDPAVGRYVGVVVSAIFGCTVSFTIPIGMGMLAAPEKRSFARGMLYGLASMPAALLLGAVLCGLSPLTALWQLTPVLAASALVLAGVRWRTEATLRAFQAFATGLQGLITLGLILGAVQSMTGWTILPGLASLEEAMAVVSSIGIVLLGSLPVGELLQRLLKRPLAALGDRLGLDNSSMTGLLLTPMSVLPTLTMMKHMNERGQIVNAAAAVCATSALAAQMGFTVSQAPDMLGALLISKLAGGVLGAAAALLATRRRTEPGA